MHLPDPSVISFSAAVVSLATAITGVVRLCLEKKSGKQSSWSKKTHSSYQISFLKKLISVPRRTANLFKRKREPVTQRDSFEYGSSVHKALADMNVAVVRLTAVDNDHLDSSNLNRVFKYYI